VSAAKAGPTAVNTIAIVVKVVRIRLMIFLPFVAGISFLALSFMLFFLNRAFSTAVFCLNNGTPT
jgi:hypothetical protein